jgi:hypothetical protein
MMRDPLPDPFPALPPPFLHTPDAARFLGLSGRTLEKHRTYGTGPKFRKIGGRVVYALEDLKAWADRGVRTSTSDPGVGTVYPAAPRERLARTPGRPRSVPVTASLTSRETDDDGDSR